MARVNEHGDGCACAIIVAGGTGSRFGRAGGKQLVELAGMPVLAWSVRAFDAAPSVASMVVVVPASRLEEMRELVLGAVDCHTPLSFAPSGPTRQMSVRSGLGQAPESCELVAIHDGARPLIGVQTIEASLQALANAPQLGGVICASRVTDTLKVSADGATVDDTPDRTRYWAAQTPQVFRRAEILHWHELAADEGFEATDDAALAEHFGKRVGLVEAPRDNIKVTLPEDLALAEALLALRGSSD